MIEFSNIKKMTLVPNEGFLILLDADKMTGERLDNLMLYSTSGTKRWSLRPDGHPDFVTEYTVNGSAVKANTFSGYVLWIRMADGTLERKEFSK